MINDSNKLHIFIIKKKKIVITAKEEELNISSF